MTTAPNNNVRTRPLLAGFGGSATAYHAARWAAEEASRRHQPLVLARTYSREIHSPLSWTPVGLPENVTRSLHAVIALDELAREFREAFPDIPVTARLREGVAAVRLNALADELDAELVVLGGPHSGAVSRMLLGTTTDQLLKAIKHPVVTVPDSREPASERAPVVVGVDDDEADHEVIEFAFDFAERHGCAVHAVHGGSRAQKSAERHCERTLASARARHDNVAAHIDVVTEAPVEALLARATGARLLVVGNHHHNAVHRAVRGSICHAVLHSAHCPVAVVPTQV
jgi:nucleotide-binding universal stress UspA family protein